MKPRWLLWLVIGLTLIAIGFIWGFHAFHDFAETKAKDALIIESAKTLLQVVGIAALGGWLKFLYDEVTDQRREAEKEREQERISQTDANEIRKGLLNDLIAARSRVEEARIKYRIEESMNALEQYRTTILAILDARLSLSRIWNAIETSKYLFPAFEEINTNLNKMKVYLDGLINEYETQIGALRELPEAEQIGHLRELEVFGDFVVNAPTSKYGENFLVKAYRPAVREIRMEVLRARQVNIEAQINQDSGSQD
ncbi:MAG TPA: hypothetical protein VFY61_18775 [Pyrinomonadaceae bacterium]|nr:hypothetical protein [Pyrinomonadaceae bacterium]